MSFVVNRSYFLLLHNKCINDLLVMGWRTTKIVYVSNIMRRLGLPVGAIECIVEEEARIGITI